MKILNLILAGLLFGLVACKSGIDPKMIESMTAENTEWNAKLTAMQEANTSIATEHDAMVKTLVDSLGEAKMKAIEADATKAAEMKSMNDAYTGLVNSHNELIGDFTSFLSANTEWINSLADGKTPAEEVTKLWEEKKTEAAAKVSKHEEMVKSWNDWKAKMASWMTEAKNMKAGKK